ncbi:MAG: hypothetical protein HY537_18450, partial [Deltaproteobacteria bacterium]|nr:hypothetical protein [Deltaproteobacteria bacterium]
MNPMFWKKRQSPQEKWITKLFGFLPFLGALCAVYILMQAKQIEERSRHTLTASALQQENLRNVLWINLLVQRTSDLVLMARLKNNPLYVERAKTIADSITQYLENAEGISKSSANTVRHSIEEFQSAVHSFGNSFNSDRASSNSQKWKLVFALANRVGEMLNQIESNEWYRLQDSTAQFRSEINRNQANLVHILTLFVTYLGFLAWAVHRKNKANETLRRNEAENKRLIGILQGTSDFVAMADKKSDLVFMNLSGRKLLGIG